MQLKKCPLKRLFFQNISVLNETLLTLGAGLINQINQISGGDNGQANKRESQEENIYIIGDK